MNSFFKKSIISILALVIFLAPFSAGFKTNEKGYLALNIEKNKALALNVLDCFFDSSINVVKDAQSPNSNSANIEGVLKVSNKKYPECTTRDTNDPVRGIYAYTKVGKIDMGGGAQIWDIQFIIKKNGQEIKRVPYPRIPGLPFGNQKEEYTFNFNTKLLTNDSNPLLLEPNTNYSLSLYINGSGGNGEVEKITTFTTKQTDTTDSTNNYDISGSGTSSGEGTLDLGCGIFNLGGCVAQLFYTVWEVSAWFARLAGEFLDFFIYYSTNSSSYENGFVKQAWAAVRDIANIFFIIALIYVAIKTILGLNVSNNKKLVGAVIVVALFINFSLFATEVVIDGTNILAKVFYNNIVPKNADSNLKDATTGSNGQKSISVGLVDKYDIQKLVTPKSYQEMGQGRFIFITFILILLTLYTAFIFFSVALLFVGRVVSLWVSMIFSPIAFVSNAVPFKMEGFSWDEWLTELMKNAFLAPLFIFFLYLIIMFANSLNEIITYAKDTNLSSAQNFMQEIMSVVVPFIILFIFLKKAKELAVKYAGEMGREITGAGAKLAGLTLGATAGGLAMASRQTVGRGMAAAANSGWAKKWEAAGWGGGMARSMFKAGATGSMDVRKIKIMGKDLASTGLKVNTLGKPQEGGFEKIRKEKVAKKQQRAKELEVGEDEKLKQHLNEAEENLQALLGAGSHELEQLDKQLKGAIDASKAAAAAHAADKDNEDLKLEAQETAARVKEIRAQKKIIKNAKGADFEMLETRAIGAEFDANRARAAATAAIGTADYERLNTESIRLANTAKATRAAANVANISRSIKGGNSGKSINDFEDEIIPEVEHHLVEENRARKWKFADQTAAWGGKANREAANKIRMNAKIEKTGGKKNDHHEAPAHHEPAPAHHAPEPSHTETPSHDEGGGEHHGH